MMPTLDSKRLVESAERIRLRIDERFPKSGLASVAAGVVTAARDSSDRAAEIARPNLSLRVGLGVLAAIALGGVAAYFPAGTDDRPAWREVMEFLEAAKGSVAILTAAAVFLFTLEVRVKRRRALRAVHELRALAHLVDMYQLGKDPTLLGRQADAHVVSGKLLDAQSMRQYLHSCTELLAVVGKLGQLYVQDFPDPAAVTAVDQYEDLAASLSSKIWQKLMILDRVSSASVAHVGEAALAFTPVAPDALR